LSYVPPAEETLPPSEVATVKVYVTVEGITYSGLSLEQDSSIKKIKVANFFINNSFVKVYNVQILVL